MSSWKSIRKQFIERASKDLYKAAGVAIDELYREASHMYDSFIDQYYSYATKSYIRHGESYPGTQRGINLYRGTQIDKDNTNSLYLHLKFDGSDMEGYRRKGVSTDFVLESMFQGYRGLPWGQWTEWVGSYEGRYFSYTGTPLEAFTAFNENFSDIANEIIREEMRDMGWNI